MDAELNHHEIRLERMTPAPMDGWNRAGNTSVLRADAEFPEGGQCNQAMSIAVIDDRILMRECFAKSIEAAREGISVLCFSTVDEWQAVAGRHAGVSLVLLCCSGRRIAANNPEIEALSRSVTGIPVVLVCDEEDAEEIHKAISLGARGFIPASVDLRLAVMAMHLVKAGGIYLPESILYSSQRPPQETNGNRKQQIHGFFTERQAAVVDALRKGKPNKIIAYELNMRESTVKVHIRNVMKKLNAKNRTEVAFLTNKLFGDDID
jgi:DNA-binding NarL/FixJ family response regulator